MFTLFRRHGVQAAPASGGAASACAHSPRPRARPSLSVLSLGAAVVRGRDGHLSPGAARQGEAALHRAWHATCAHAQLPRNSQDFALVDSLTVQFCPGLNVITGASGSGKSLLVRVWLGGRVTSLWPHERFSGGRRRPAVRGARVGGARAAARGVRGPRGARAQVCLLSRGAHVTMRRSPRIRPSSTWVLSTSPPYPRCSKARPASKRAVLQSVCTPNCAPYASP